MVSTNWLMGACRHPNNLRHDDGVVLFKYKGKHRG